MFASLTPIACHFPDFCLCVQDLDVCFACHSCQQALQPVNREEMERSGEGSAPNGSGNGGANGSGNCSKDGNGNSRCGPAGRQKSCCSLIAK